MTAKVNELRPVVCPKCGRVLASVLDSVKVLCPKCKVWSTNKNKAS